MITTPAGFWNQCTSYCGHGSQCVEIRGHGGIIHCDGHACAWPDGEACTDTQEADRAMIDHGMPVILVIRDRMAEITYAAVYGDRREVRRAILRGRRSRRDHAPS